MGRRLQKLFLGLCGIAFLAAATAQANALLVTSTADGGAGTLRAALASATNGDTIDATGVSGTILLTSGELLVSKSVTILGPGPANLAVDGNFASRVFHIGSNTVVSISSLTVADGIADLGGGGGILNDHATLTVSNCTVSGNSVSDSYGGGIMNDGESGSATLEIVNSTLSGNSAGLYGDGGGIENFGCDGIATLAIANSTLRDNRAGGGGGIDNNNIQNGQLQKGSAMVTIANSTLSGNFANGAGGAILNFATLTIANSTLSGNAAGRGGGIDNNTPYGIAMLEIGNTILDAGAYGGTLFNSGTVISHGYNLSSDDGGGVLTATGDQINTDPKLGPLQDNGGPTFTYALLCGSPAIDQGKRDTIPALASGTDQRGFARPVDFPAIADAAGGDGSDIGALESSAPQTLTVLNTNDSGAGSLRQAILDASASAGADVIEFASSGYGRITLTSGELRITDCLSINGPGAANVVVDGNGANRVFYVGSNIVVSISSLTIANGLATGEDFPADSGGGIYNDRATLTLSNCTVSGNSAHFGGGIFSGGEFGGGATLTVSNCTLSGNGATYYGGGIDYEGGFGGATLTIANSTVSGNSAGTGGGGILNVCGFAGTATVEIVNSTVSGNSAQYSGGGIWNESSGTLTLTVSNCTVSGNSASNSFSGFGGGIRNDGATVEIVNSTISGNSAHFSGGGILNNGANTGSATLTIANSTISSNWAGVSGGGSANDGADGVASLQIVNSTLNGNLATSGGGVFNQGKGGAYSSVTNPSVASLQIVNSTLSGNSASNGGSIFNQGVGIISIPFGVTNRGVASLQIVNSTLSGNLAINGGDVYNEVSSFGSATLEIGSTILNAGGSGGNITNLSGSVTSLGYNLNSDAAGGDGTTGPGGLLNSTGDIRNTNPLLDPAGLQNNGGPTPTIALQPTSPAIDQGKRDTIPALASDTDQRGFARPVDFPAIANAVGGDGTDIGAFEVQSLNNPPVPQCHDVTVSAGTDCTADASIDNGSSDPDAGDTITLSQSPVGPYAIGDTLVTLTVTDNHGASNSCAATVTVADGTAPSITQCATSIVASANANCQAAVPDFTAGVTASDNCPPNGSLVITQDPAAGTLVGLGTTTVTIAVTDAANNNNTCTTIFSVVDDTPPSVTRPGNISTNIPSGQTSAVVNYPPATASDNCSAVTVNSTPPSGSSFPLGTTTVTCTATDGAGNTNSCSFTVTVTQAAPTSGPELTGTWSNLVQSCKTKNDGLHCKVKGRLIVQNIGTADAGSSFVRYYLSSNNQFDAGDLLLKQRSTGKLKPGKSKKPTLSAQLPTGVNGSGQFIIAVIDANNTVAESSENDNVIVYGPLP